MKKLCRDKGLKNRDSIKMLCANCGRPIRAKRIEESEVCSKYEAVCSCTKKTTIVISD